MIVDVLTVAVLYLGTGFLLSRFLRSSVRDIPLTWLVLTVSVLPLLISASSAFVPVSHRGVLLLSGLCITAGVVLTLLGRVRRLPSWSVVGQEGRAGRLELCAYAGLALVFIAALIGPKLSLVQSIFPTIYDDVNNAHKALSAGFRLDPPMYYHMPFVPLNYYYYDFLLPGLVFRLTSLTLQQSLFVHNMLEYAAILSVFVYAACALCRTVRARAVFLLGATFLGGMDLLGYRFAGAVPDHLEWWARDLPLAKDFNVQISSFYTLFLWVPQHLMAGMLFLLALLQLPARTVQQRFVLVVLFAAMLGFSTFVFLAALAAVVAGELLLLHAHRWPRALLRWLPAHALLFCLLSANILLLYAERRSNVLSFDPKALDILPASASAAPPFLQDLLAFLLQAGDYVLTWTAVLIVDAGAVALLAFLFLLRAPRGRLWPRQRLPDTAFFAAVALVTAGVLLSFVSSINYNDMFMRGIIVAQISAVVLAALFMEEHRRLGSLTVMLVAAMATVQFLGTLYEWRHRSSFAPVPPEAVYRFLRDETPKDAVVFTDADICGDVTYRGNRVCVNRMDRVDLQYAAPQGDDPLDYNDPRAIAHLELEHPAYFVTRVQKDLPGFRGVFHDDQFHVYAMPLPNPALL